jgi:glutathione S-transferase
MKAAADLDVFFDLINNAISGEPYFLPNGYSALDLYLTMLTEWSDDKDALFSNRPALAALTQTTVRRPAYQAAMQRHILPNQAA